MFLFTKRNIDAAILLEPDVDQQEPYVVFKLGDQAKSFCCSYVFLLYGIIIQVNVIDSRLNCCSLHHSVIIVRFRCFVVNL